MYPQGVWLLIDTSLDRLSHAPPPKELNPNPAYRPQSLTSPLQTTLYTTYLHDFFFLKACGMSQY